METPCITTNETVAIPTEEDGSFAETFSTNLLRMDIVLTATFLLTQIEIQYFLVLIHVEGTQISTTFPMTLWLKHALAMIPNLAPEIQDPMTITNHLEFSKPNETILRQVMPYFPLQTRKMTKI